MKTIYDKDGNVLGTFLEEGDATSGGGGSSSGGSSTDLDGLYPNSRVAELIEKLAGGGSGDDYAYITLSDLRDLLNATTDLSQIPVTYTYGEDVLSINLSIPYVITGSNTRIYLTNAKISFDFHEDSGTYVVVINVQDGTSYGNTIFNTYLYISEPSANDWDSLLYDLISEEGDQTIYLSTSDSGSLHHFTDGTERAVSQPFLFGLTILVGDEASSGTPQEYYGRLDLDDFMDIIHLTYEE